MTDRKPWLLVAGLTLTWLLLAERMTPTQLLLGLGISMFVVFRFRAVRPIHPRLRERPFARRDRPLKHVVAGSRLSCSVRTSRTP